MQIPLTQCDSPPTYRPGSKSAEYFLAKKFSHFSKWPFFPLSFHSHSRKRRVKRRLRPLIIQTMWAYSEIDRQTKIFLCAYLFCCCYWVFKINIPNEWRRKYMRKKVAEIEICICKKSGYLCNSNQKPVSESPLCFRKSISEILVCQVWSFNLIQWSLWNPCEGPKMGKYDIPSKSGSTSSHCCINTLK